MEGKTKEKQEEKQTKEKQTESQKEHTEKNRIVMINSFKGGAGKTTAALCRCVFEYKEVIDHNIYYVDLDILGTGVDYVLSVEKQKTYYNDTENGRSLSQKVQEIMRDEKTHNRFYAAVLNPVSRIKQAYGGQDRLRAHPDVERGIFRQKVKTLINQILDCREKNLIVLDCAPGISYMEESLLEDFYQMEQNPRKKVSVEEIFVTTPDAAHIRKTIESLNSCAAYLIQHKKTATVLINDVFNCEGMSRKEKDEGRQNFVFSQQKIIEDMKKDLEAPVKFLYQSYSESLLKGNIIKNEVKLKNRMDDYYVWPKEPES